MQKSSIPAALLQFLFQRVEILCLKKLTQGDIQSAADLLMVDMVGLLLGRAKILCTVDWVIPQSMDKWFSVIFRSRQSSRIRCWIASVNVMY